MVVAVSLMVIVPYLWHRTSAAAGRSDRPKHPGRAHPTKKSRLVSRTKRLRGTTLVRHRRSHVSLGRGNGRTRTRLSALTWAVHPANLPGDLPWLLPEPRFQPQHGLSGRRTPVLLRCNVVQLCGRSIPLHGGAVKRSEEHTS